MKIICFFVIMILSVFTSCTEHQFEDREGESSLILLTGEDPGEPTDKLEFELE